MSASRQHSPDAATGSPSPGGTGGPSLGGATGVGLDSLPELLGGNRSASATTGPSAAGGGSLLGSGDLAGLAALARNPMVARAAALPGTRALAGRADARSVIARQTMTPPAPATATPAGAGGAAAAKPAMTEAEAKAKLAANRAKKTAAKAPAPGTGPLAQAAKAAKNAAQDGKAKPAAPAPAGPARGPAGPAADHAKQPPLAGMPPAQQLPTFAELAAGELAPYVAEKGEHQQWASQSPGGGADHSQSGTSMALEALAAGGLEGVGAGLQQLAIDTVLNKATRQIPYASGFIAMAQIAYDPGKWAQGQADAIWSKGIAGGWKKIVGSNDPIDKLEGVINLLDGINAVISLCSTICMIVAAATFLLSFIPGLQWLAPFAVLAADWGLLLGSINTWAGIILSALRLVLMGFRFAQVAAGNADPETRRAQAAKLRETTRQWSTEFTLRKGAKYRDRKAQERRGEAAQQQPRPPATTALQKLGRGAEAALSWAGGGSAGDFAKQTTTVGDARRTAVGAKRAWWASAEGPGGRKEWLRNFEAAHGDNKPFSDATKKRLDAHADRKSVERNAELARTELKQVQDRAASSTKAAQEAHDEATGLRRQADAARAAIAAADNRARAGAAHADARQRHAEAEQRKADFERSNAEYCRRAAETAAAKYAENPQDPQLRYLANAWRNAAAKSEARVAPAQQAAQAAQADARTARAEADRLAAAQAAEPQRQQAAAAAEQATTAEGRSRTAGAEAQNAEAAVSSAERGVAGAQAHVQQNERDRSGAAQISAGRREMAQDWRDPSRRGYGWEAGNIGAKDLPAYGYGHQGTGGVVTGQGTPFLLDALTERPGWIGGGPWLDIIGRNIPSDALNNPVRSGLQGLDLGRTTQPLRGEDAFAPPKTPIPPAQQRWYDHESKWMADRDPRAADVKGDKALQADQQGWDVDQHKPLPPPPTEHEKRISDAAADFAKADEKQRQIRFQVEESKKLMGSMAEEASAMDALKALHNANQAALAKERAELAATKQAQAKTGEALDQTDAKAKDMGAKEKPSGMQEFVSAFIGLMGRIPSDVVDNAGEGQAAARKVGQAADAQGRGAGDASASIGAGRSQLQAMCSEADEAKADQDETDRILAQLRDSFGHGTNDIRTGRELLGEASSRGAAEAKDLEAKKQQAKRSSDDSVHQLRDWTDRHRRERLELEKDREQSQRASDDAGP